MRTLPLFYYPSTWLYVDDDKTLLGCMGLAFDEVSKYKTFSSPRSCLDFLNQYISPSRHQYFFNNNAHDENYGMLNHTPIDFDITKLAQFSNNDNRYDEITAMVIDYDMPEMNGFSLSQACDHLPISKILLTGNTKDERVIDGFNQNVIQHYIQKGSENFEDRVVSQLEILSFDYFKRITSPLLAYLEVENPLPLSDPIFVAFFLEYSKRKNICEYYLMDKQGSYLCVDREGQRHYFVVHTDRALDAWMKIYFTGTEFSPDFAEKIVDRERIPFFGQGVEAWQLDTTEWHSYFHRPEGVIEGREKYYWFGVSEADFRSGKKSW